MATLENVASQYNLVLIDTCALVSVLGLERPDYIEGKIDYYTFQGKLMDFWSENIPFYSEIYSVQEVLEELTNTQKYNYKKHIKRNGSSSYTTNLGRSIKKGNKSRRKLVNLFDEQERILKLNSVEKVVYQNLYEEYDELIAQHKLKGADFPLLISGAAISEIQSPTAIISNDFGIFNSYKFLMAEENLNPNQFGFFVRRGEDTFIRLYLNRKE